MYTSSIRNKNTTYFLTGNHMFYSWVTDFLWDKVPLCSSGYPRSCYIDQAGLKPWVLLLKACAPMPNTVHCGQQLWTVTVMLPAHMLAYWGHHHFWSRIKKAGGKKYYLPNLSFSLSKSNNESSNSEEVNCLNIKMPLKRIFSKG